MARSDLTTSRLAAPSATKAPSTARGESKTMTEPANAPTSPDVSPGKLRQVVAASAAGTVLSGTTFLSMGRWPR